MVMIMITTHNIDDALNEDEDEESDIDILPTFSLMTSTLASLIVTRESLIW